MFGAVVLLAAIAAAEPEMIPAEALEVVGSVAPSVGELALEDGSTFRLEDHRGKTIILSFWASWCPPCKGELPALDVLSRQRGDVQIFTVNVDKQEALALRFLRQLGHPMDLSIVWDPQAMALGQFGVTAMPTLFVIDARGVVRHKKVGYGEKTGLSDVIDVLDSLR